MISRLQFKVPISHRAKRVTKNDFKTFTHILAADHSNLEYLKRMMPKDAVAKVDLWGSYLNGKAILDPYYGGIVSYSSFDQICSASVHPSLAGGLRDLFPSYHGSLKCLSRQGNWTGVSVIPNHSGHPNDHEAINMYIVIVVWSARQCSS
jgi:Low molecular weight phosphotyrosine protein phosphatase